MTFWSSSEKAYYHLYLKKSAHFSSMPLHSRLDAFSLDRDTTADPKVADISKDFETEEAHEKLLSFLDAPDPPSLLLPPKKKAQVATHI